MAKVKVEVNPQGVAQLLNGPEITDLLESMGNDIAAVAGDGHEVETWHGATRARITVRTDTYEARHAEATDRALTRAIEAGRR